MFQGNTKLEFKEYFGISITAVAALDKVVLKHRRVGVAVDIIGMNQATSTLVDWFGIDTLMSH